LGIALAKTGIISYPWYESAWLGVKSAFSITWEIIKGFANLFKNLLFQGRIPQELSGPVGIAVLTNQAANLGFIYLLQLVAIVSLNLTILNLLPFPALDGGRLLFLAIEKIKGSKVNPKIENAFHSIGLVLIFVLFILLTYRDILRLK
jgi:regulator of sigma E protease